MDYVLILKNSINSLKKKKFWLFGILLAFFSSNFYYNYQYEGRTDNVFWPSSQYNQDFNITRYSNELDFLREIEPGRMLVIVLMILLLALFIGLIIFILRLILMGSLIGGLYKSEMEKELSIGQIFVLGWNSAFRLFGVGFVIWVVPVIVFGLLIIAAIIPVVISPEAGWILFCLFLPLIIVLIILVVIPLGIIQQLAYRFTVIKKNRIFTSISAGMSLFKQSLGWVLLAWLILLGIGIAFALVNGLISAITILPFQVLIQGEEFNQSLLRFLASIPGSLIILILTGFMLIFSTSYWNGVFQQLISKDTNKEKVISEKSGTLDTSGATDS